LVRTIFDAGLVEPTAVLGNVMVEGLRETALVAIPVRLRTCGDDGSLSAICTLAALVPVACGWNVTLIVQLLALANALPEGGQLFVSL
jgi:hypothetical protein